MAASVIVIVANWECEWSDARWFRQVGQVAFFDVKVFNLSLKRYAKQELLKAYENSKKEKYHASEHGTLIPLVMAANVGVGRE